MIQHDIINSKCSVRLDPCYNSVKMSSLKPDDIKAALGYNSLVKGLTSGSLVRTITEILPGLARV